MEEKDLNGKCLYTPKVSAREYAAVGCNFYRGCPNGCTYCYNKRGITSGTLGGDRPVLMNKFTDMKYRPKKYAYMESEIYAFTCFTGEVQNSLDYLRETGIFFSFTTDPMCLECFALTWMAVDYAVAMRVPVRVLTKNAGYNFVQKALMLKIPQERRQLLSVGLTLTGRDDCEPYASKNDERIKAMKWFKDAGFRTFASIEPIVDFESSYKMVKKTADFCEMYLIGLMSKRSRELPPYTKNECAQFIKNVNELLSCWKCQDTQPSVYWKGSVRKLMKDDSFAMNTILLSPVSIKEFQDNIWRIINNK